MNEKIPAPAPPEKKSRRNSASRRGGFYLHAFQDCEIRDLQAVNATLQDEIVAMRLAGRRMLELADQVGDPAAAIRCYAAFSAHNLRIAHLLQIHNSLTGDRSDSLKIFHEAISATLARKMKEP